MRGHGDSFRAERQTARGALIAGSERDRDGLTDCFPQSKARMPYTSLGASRYAPYCIENLEPRL